MRLKFTPVARLVEWGIVAVAYFITAQIGFAMAIPPGNVTAVWPPSGIALAAVMLLGYRVLPGIWLGSFVANVWSFAGLSAPILATAAGIAIGSTLQALIGAYLIQRWIDSNNPFDRTQDVFKFVGLELISCLVAATFGATSLAVGRFITLSAYLEVWWTWWLGDLVGIIVVTPAVIAWARPQPTTRDVRRLIEATISLVLLLAVGLRVFSGPPQSSGVLNPLSYTFIPFIVWAALRFGPHAVTASILVVSATAIWGTARGSGPFVLGSLNESLIALQAFIAIEAVTGLTLMASLRERKQAEERFQMAIESAPNAILMVDQRGQIVLVNAQLEKYFGYDRAELIGENVDRLVPERLRGNHPNHRGGFYSQPIARNMGVGRDLYALRKDGSEFPVEIGLAPIETQTGTMVSATIVDITARKQAEEEIRKLNLELEQRFSERTAQLEIANIAIKELEAFTYSVSHDLRAPLRAIDGYTRILLEDYESALDAEGKRVCGVISQEAQRMGQLIDDLLTFARLGRKEMSASSIDMQTLASSVFNELITEAERERIDFRMGQLPVAVGDAALIRQVWINLISNAIKFTSKKERAVIEVGNTRNDSETIYFVRDSGAGFDMEYADKLFGVFQRLHSEKEFEGTGVGLAIAQRVIHRHGGRVWAEGEVDKGATFYFALPKKENKYDRSE